MSHLGPRELEQYYIADSEHARGQKNEAKATIEVRVGSDWENGTEVVRHAGDQLTEFGRVCVIGPNVEVYEPLSELDQSF